MQSKRRGGRNEFSLDPVKYGSRDSDRPVSPLVHLFGAGKDEDTRLILKNSDDGAHGKAGQLGYFRYCENRFVQRNWPSTIRAKRLVDCIQTS
jgi:hypothetical protein